MAFASYNPFHGPILRDTLIVVVVDAITCIICGLCVFSTMGNLALEQGVSVDDVIADGPGLVFVVFPHALAKMPIPQLWSGLFFFMLILLGIDSQVSQNSNSHIFREILYFTCLFFIFNSFQFSTVEVVITSLKDGFGDWIDRYIKRHEILVLIVCVLGFLCGIPYIFNVNIFFLFSCQFFLLLPFLFL